MWTYYYTSQYTHAFDLWIHKTSTAIHTQFPLYYRSFLNRYYYKWSLQMGYGSNETKHENEMANNKSKAKNLTCLLRIPIMCPQTNNKTAWENLEPCLASSIFIINFLEQMPVAVNSILDYSSPVELSIIAEIYGVLILPT